MVGVEQWAEIRRLYSGRAVVDSGDQQADGVASQDDPPGVGGEVPPRYSRAPAGSKLDPFKEWICEQLRADPTIQSLRLREMAGRAGL